MTHGVFSKLPTNPYRPLDIILSCMNERDLHTTSLTCKTLKNEANNDRYWAPFLQRRFLQVNPGGTKKATLVHFFKIFCTFIAKEYPAVDFRNRLITPQTSTDVFELHLLMRSFFKPAVLSARLNEIVQSPAKELARHELLQRHPDLALLCLLEAGAKLTEQTSEKAGTLQQAIDGRSTEIIQSLLIIGAKIDPSLPAQRGSLDLALASRCSLAVIKSLFAAGAKPVQTCKIDQRHWRLGTVEQAVAFGHSAETIQFLLDNKAELPVRSHKEKGILDFAAEKRASLPVLKLLVERGAKLRSSNCSDRDTSSFEENTDMRFIADFRLPIPGTIDYARDSNCSDEVIAFLQGVEEQQLGPDVSPAPTQKRAVERKVAKKS